MTDEGFYSLLVHAVCRRVRWWSWSTRTRSSGAWSSRSSTRRWGGRSRAWATSTAKWHRDTVRRCRRTAGPTGSCSRPQGRGRFCGVMLHVWNPRGGWWGEGDEKFFVDGEKFPSTFGTGSEDYFGYAWCNPHLFQRPYHAQTMTQNNRGHQSVLRWHIVDNVPFQKSFEGCIEKYYQERPRHALRLHRAAGTWPPAAATPTSRCPWPSATATTSCPQLVVGGFKVLSEPPRQRAASRPWATSAGASGRTTSSSGGPGPSPATSWSWAVPVAHAGTLRGERRPDQGPRLRHRATCLDGKKAGRADRPLQPAGDAHRADLAGHARSGRRPAQADGGDRRRQPEGGEVATCSASTASSSSRSSEPRRPIPLVASSRHNDSSVDRPGRMRIPPSLTIHKWPSTVCNPVRREHAPSHAAHGAGSGRPREARSTRGSAREGIRGCCRSPGRASLRRGPRDGRPRRFPGQIVRRNPSSKTVCTSCQCDRAISATSSCRFSSIFSRIMRPRA